MAANKENDPFFKEMIFGHIAFAKMVDSDFADSLFDTLKSIDWTNYDEDITDSRESELIMRSLEKKHYYHPVVVSKSIESETDLLKAIYTTFIELKHYIEDRR